MTSKRLIPYPVLRTTALTACLLATGALAQVAPTPTPLPPSTAPATPAPARPPVTLRNAENGAAEEVVSLSPFEVVADTRGYFSANSMSGTRFNTKVEDLASSLTVITKEQMDDFAMLDINDVFNFTAGTEGTATYTDYVIDRNGQLQDNVQLDPSNANRVRGILAANQSYGNFETTRLTMDRMIIDGVEISRGPNANVFGLGYAAGTFNQVPASANLTRNRTRVEARADSYDGYRTALDFNRVLKKGVLAVRVNGVFQHDGFIRKPSGMDTVRYNGFVKYQPFQNTTITASFLYTRSEGNRPNFTPPRDSITDWVNAGKPTWDPVLQVIHLNGQTIDRNGVVSGGRALVPITADSSIPAYIPLSRGPNNSRAMLYVDTDGIKYWTAPGATSSVNSALITPAGGSQSVRYMMTNPLGSSGGKYSGQPLWTTTPTIGDHSYYDWSAVNLSAPNRQWDRVKVYHASLDQVLLNTPRQTLVVQGSVFREDAMRYQRQPLGNSGISGQTGQYFVDIDERRLDGTPNPFFLRPYIAAGEFTTRYAPAKWDTYRLQAAYKLDLRGEKNWLKWLGLHQLTGYDEYKYRINRQWSYREALASNHTWTQAGYTGFNANQGRSVQSNVTGGPQAGPAVVRQYYRYYVGDTNSVNVAYAPGNFEHGTYPFSWGGYRTQTGGVVDPASAQFYNEPATLALMPTTDQTGGNYSLKQIIKTPGGVIQSHFLDGKVVTTFGMRQDKVYSKNGINKVTDVTPVGGANLLNNNTEFDWAYNNSWEPGDYRFNVGKTKTGGVVVRPFRDLRFIQEASNHGGPLGWLADAARGLSLTYNQSDNFYPQAPAIDLFRQQLPNVTGEGKDYGFWLNLADGKVVVRFNHYITKQLNIRNGDANTIAQRVLRIDMDVSSDHFQLYDRANDWFRLTHPEWSDTQVRQAIADQMQIPIDEYEELMSAFRAGSIAATNDFTASGNEIEINFNPTRHWRFSGSVTQQKAVTSNVSSVVQQWIDRRMPVWTSIVDQNFNPSLGTGVSQGWEPTADNPQHLWWTHGYNRTSFPNGYYANNVAAPYKVIKQQEGKARPNIREYNVKFAASVDLAAFTEQRYLKNVRVGASGNWQDKAAIGYYGVQQLPDVVTDLDPNRPVWDKARLYVGAFVSYRTKLFNNRVAANFQLNVENLGENGRLQPIGAFPDGTPNAYRIVDPQKFILSASFDL
ncbi:TonB-dependent receptor [Opitutus sp. ER46]|uniref:TonB-dependent receptor n=1 Tax=Opitutus sp. ER46 TaxID=2161864 RepID=UPI001304D466|nr:TonB-dependent receptor [Opitutus sp. ER46]